MRRRVHKHHCIYTKVARNCGTALSPVQWIKDKRGNNEAPFLVILRIRPAFIMAATLIFLGHFAQLGTFLNKKYY